MDERERHERGYAMARLHVDSGGKIGVVSFKDEDEERGQPIGPVLAYAEGIDPRTLPARPFGDPDPEGVFYLGWQTRAAARKLAKSVGAKMEEW